VPIGDLEALESLLVGMWCSRVDALPRGQWADVVNDGYGVTRYISKMLAHGLKAEQAPPVGWRGHRTSQTRGYLVRPAKVMREAARRSLREKRTLWKLSTANPELDAWTLDELLALELAAAESVEWSCVKVESVPAPLRWADTGRKIVA
jgi:hypothetical protein